MYNLKECSDKDLYELMMIYFSQIYQYDYLGSRRSIKLKYQLEGQTLKSNGDPYEEGFYNLIGEFQYSIEELRKEFVIRKLERPLYVIPSPKTLIVLPIKVESKKTGIIVPDSIVVNDIEKYKDHPFQGIILALDKSIEWDALYIGAQICLKSPQAEIFRWDGVSYRYISYSSIIAII